MIESEKYEDDKFEDFFDLYADNDPEAVEVKADLMELANKNESPSQIFGKVGMYHLADELAKNTEQPRIIWLQRIAAAFSGMPGTDEKFFKIDYVDLKKMEAQGLETVKQLAAQECFFEHIEMERLLSSIWLQADQVEFFKAKRIRRYDKESLHRVYAYFAENLRREGKTDEEIIKVLFDEYPQLTDRKIGRAVFGNADDSTRKKVNRITCNLRASHLDQ